jgi:outer membrane protein assembly factor BamD (BamD/ComL family)
VKTWRSLSRSKSYSMLSPVYSLDQADTTKALDKLQAFIDNYPNSQYLGSKCRCKKVLSEKITKRYTKMQRVQHHFWLQIKLLL